MNDLLDMAVNAHGGLQRWNEFTKLKVELSTDDLHQLEIAASKIAVQGARYPEELQKLVGR